MNTKLSIIVPCYNEEMNIPDLLAAFDAVIQRSDIELVVVNNGSTDNSEQVLNRLIGNYSFARVHHVAKNIGYGFGIMSGLREAKGDFLGWTHADLQTDPQDIIKALNIIEEKQNDKNLYVKGDRKKRPIFDQFFTSGMSLFESLYMGKKLWDINAQPNVFHRSFFEKWKMDAPNDFSLDLYVLYMAKHLNLEVTRFDVTFPERQHGESSWNTGLPAKWKFIKRTLEFSIELKRELKHDLLYRS
jgi:glycosyltransferase involved in cell wall biosynthesis